ncbi:MAG TPA: hypothetical protein V6D05_11810 [Stenomitos sp.]
MAALDSAATTLPPAAPTPDAPWRRFATPLGIFLVFWALYAISGTLEGTPYNAHVWMADAMLHGRFGLVNPPAQFEMVKVGNFYQVAYGVGPALLMLPFVAVFGLGFHQALFSAAVGAATVVLWWSTLGRLKFEGQVRYWLTATMGAGSYLWFYAGQTGSTWMLTHMVVVFGLMLAIWETLGKQRGWLVGLGFGLAVLSRQTVLPALPFFLGMLWRDDRSQGGPSAIRKELWFAVGLGALMAFEAFYNFARFGNPFDNGYELVNRTLYGAAMTHGSFSMEYFASNFRLYFVRMPLRLHEFPWFDPTKDGFSIFLTTPALFLAFYANFRERVTALALVAAVLVQAVYLVYFGTGWVQFGCRYALDYFPFAMLLIASGTEKRLSPALVTVTLLGALVEVWGLFWWGLKGW